MGGGIRWSADGQQAAVMLRANDNKDRWIISVNAADGRVQNRHRLTDNAWINWGFNDFGWMADGRTLWLLSEESGFSHLYTQAGTAKPQALTSGKGNLGTGCRRPMARASTSCATRRRRMTTKSARSTPATARCAS